MVGSIFDPVFLTSAGDDQVGGDSNGDGSNFADRGRLDNIFATGQLNIGWTVPAGALGVDIDRVGPGQVSVHDAVVRRTQTAFASCLVCTIHVHDTDFVDVGTAVSQAFYFIPLVPCLSLMGQEILDGRNAIWNPADATGNYWGSPTGPTSAVNPIEVASAAIGQEDQWRHIMEGVPTEQFEALQTLKDNTVTQWGPDIPLFDTPAAEIAVSVQTCTIPVINFSFPVVVVPVDYVDYRSVPIHTNAEVGPLP